MKKILILLTLLVSSIAFSQAPEGINYQAVIRNSSGNLVASTTVAIRVQVRQTTATGTVVYQERHSVLTSAQGLVNMVIGAGTPQVGTFNGINWGMGPFFVNLAVDFANGINYQDFGTQQLMSVPYALYAKTAGNQLNQWRYGNTAPPSTLGNFGDFYLDVITGNVYYKNSGTAWILTGNIKGPVGPTGPAGATGPQGAQGPQGIQGVTGPTGATGPQGPIGLTGPSGTSGPQGAQGPQGVAGTNGTNGQNTLVKTTTEAAGVNCTTGGIKIEFGLDANGNGILDAGEINAILTKYVCNGATGATGPQGPQGVAGPQGAAGTNGINGTNGTNGQNSLVKTTTELAGVNCTTGGIKIEYGLDSNNNGILDLSEINASLTKFVCNGAVGATGLQGPAGVAGAQGPQGIQGVAGPQGAAGSNGSNGLNALIKTTTEPAGSNCANGGTKIETGLDANANGVLDASEINTSQTKYVCNGDVSTSIGNNGTYSGNSIISNDTISPLMKYIGNGQEGDFDCNTFSGTLSGEHFYTNFKVPSNCTLQIGKGQTTIIHVKDTCFISGVINGNGGLVSPYTENRTNFIGATGDYSSVYPGCGQSGYYYKFDWTYSPEGLNQLLGYGHLKSTGERWAGAGMSLNDIRTASFLGTRIHGCTSNLPNCGNMAQGGSGLIIICRVLIFNGQILLNGTIGSAGASGGGSLIISADNIIQNFGTVSTLGGIGGNGPAGNGRFYLVNY